ncbi:MAG: FKBP-type peptidyl-prolyl cis-trans isomerase [Bacteroidetes bacterium]|nr:MAG: FKBP-type peptidyl-prolyl cis-trans isomerase [Bacteroidota bacterium]RLD83406.1 MAG: FKBP-type peptidyl-prolyl cis-trans isomerase [Bacteroidota bacterium]
MKLKLSYLVLAVAVLSFAACNNGGLGSSDFSGNVELNNELDSVSYALGADVAKNIARAGVEDLNIEAFATGLAHAMNDDSLEISTKDGQALFQAFFKKAQTQKLQKNKEEGEKFLEENKTKDGVVVLESGLQYKVITKGEGPIPNDSSKVKVHYTGTLIDGTKFDSSVDRGQPFETIVKGRIIKGWQEILQLMPVGSKYMVYVPTELGYGTQVRPGGVIEANMALVFEMELLEIVEPKK